MSSPRVFYYRLPSLAEAQRILAAAAGPGAGAAEAKAKHNLCQQLKTAYDGLAVPDKNAVQVAYRGGAAPAGEFAARLLAAQSKPTALSDADIFDLVQAFPRSPVLQHPGSQRFVVLNGAQRAVVDQTIAGLKVWVTAIRAGTHDATINMVFGIGQRVFVKRVFQLMLAQVETWQTNSKIKLDVIAPSIKAGALTNYEEGMGLPESFFGEAQNEREATFGHEGTHAILDDNYRTNDKGGYISAPNFLTMASNVRIRNAAHYEYVLRLLNGAPAHLYAPVAGAVPAEEQAASHTLKTAWINPSSFMCGS